jgi:mono/diheme cytochrome c family protein
MSLSRSFVSTLAVLMGTWGIAPLAIADSTKLVSSLGHDLAQHYCSSCHLIERGQKNPVDFVGGPAFQAVANRPDTTKESLLTHLRTTHANKLVPLQMPNPRLTHDETVKIVTYLLSLRHPE